MLTVSVKVLVYTETASTSPWTTFAARLTLPSQVTMPTTTFVAWLRFGGGPTRK